MTVQLGQAIRCYRDRAAYLVRQALLYFSIAGLSLFA